MLQIDDAAVHANITDMETSEAAATKKKTAFAFDIRKQILFRVNLV